jgi:hypothetical protein
MTMTFVKTLLGALALCAALLGGAALISGPDLAHTQTSGLTAAAVLASDGMAPDGRSATADREPPTSGRMLLSGAQDAQPAG